MMMICNQMWTVMMRDKIIQTHKVVKMKNKGSKKKVQLMQFYSYCNFIGSDTKGSDNLKSLIAELQ